MVDALADQLARLRAIRVAAYPAKDLPAFGLDNPACVLTIRLSIEGKPLDQLFSSGKRPPQRQIALLIRKVALALAEAHKRNVVHRDARSSAAASYNSGGIC